MARPTTKEDLLTASSHQLDRLIQLLDCLTETQQNGSFDWSNQKIGQEAHWTRDKNSKDVLIHLYEWHQLLLTWVSANQAGQEKSFIPTPYNWRTYGVMNVEFTKKHAQTTFNEAKQWVISSHLKVMALIESFTNEALFSKGYYQWTGGSTLGSYCVSVTASHYEWAIKKLNKYKKSFN